MGSQQARRRGRACAAGRLDVKRIHRVTRRMVLGDVERLEIVVRRLDLRPLHHRVAEREENPLDLLERLLQWMPRADRPHDPGQGKVQAIPLPGGSLDGNARSLLKSLLDVRLKRIKFLADRALQIGRSGLQPVVGDSGENSRFPSEPSAAQFLPTPCVGHRRQFVRELLLHFREQTHHACGVRDAHLRQRFRCGVVRHRRRATLSRARADAAWPVQRVR